MEMDWIQSWNQTSFCLLFKRQCR